MSTHSAHLTPTFAVEPLVLDFAPVMSDQNRLRAVSLLSALAIHGLAVLLLGLLGPMMSRAPAIPPVQRPEPVAIRLAPAAQAVAVPEPVVEQPVVTPAPVEPVVKKPAPPPVVPTRTLSQTPTVPIAAEPKVEEVPPSEPVVEPVQEPVAEVVEAPKAVAAKAEATKGPSSPFGSLGPAPINVKEAAVAPRLLHREAPEYPGRARRAGIEGLVVLRAVVGTDGKVEAEHLKVMRSVPALDESALASVLAWKFTPALDADNRPIRVIMNIPVRFRLQ